MTYETSRASFNKEHIYLVELDLDYCSREYGVSDEFSIVRCVAGEFTMGMTGTVSAPDFNIGDEIEGALSGAVGTILDILDSGATIKYVITNGVQFRNGSSETINNNTTAASQSKDNDNITSLASGDSKCYNTIETCEDLLNFTPLNPVTTGATTINAQPASDNFGRPAGSFIADGFLVGDRVRVSGFDNVANNREYTVTQVLVNSLYIDPADGLIFENGNGDEEIVLISRKSYRFCEPRSPHPIGISAIPSVKSISMTPAKIDVAGGLGERSDVSITFNDHPFNDLDIDKYVSERSYIATDRGTFWTKMRARNPNYQFRPLRVITGYLEDGVYKPENFRTLNYVIDKMDVSNGQCRITAKDTLAKAGEKKAQVPKPSNGSIDAGTHPTGITAGDTSLTLSPSGIGSEYDVSGWVTLGGSEIASYTRVGDVLTLTRAQFNTTAKAHKEDTVVQLCYRQQAEVNVIARDILVNFADIDPLFINDDEWQSAVDNSDLGSSGNLDGIIAKPTDVNKVMKELSQAKPHFIYWDELNQALRFNAIEEPPISANQLNMDEHLVKDRTRIKDLPKMRYSTVFVTFGIIDPTKSLTSPENFTQTLVRSDTDSISKYSSNQIKEITSRWIPSTNKVIANNAAQLIGRRFADIPREVTFELEDKDNDLNISDVNFINHRDMTDSSGAPVDVLFQMISKQENKGFKYKGVEYTFGQVLPGDIDLSSDKIFVSVDEQNLNLYDRYVAIFGAPGASVDAVFEIDSGVVIGSSSTLTYAIDTGSSWPGGSTIRLINRGHIVGRGGDGGVNPLPGGTDDGDPGGDAINLTYNLSLDNFGIIGGGGGGGATDYSSPVKLHGGGGAGNSIGICSNPAGNGSLETGGRWTTVAPRGGDLGQSGGDGVFEPVFGGAAGNAINTNGNTLSLDTTGDIRGAIA